MIVEMQEGECRGIGLMLTDKKWINWTKRRVKTVALRTEKGFLCFWVWGLHDACKIIWVYLVELEQTGWQSVQ